MFKLTFFFLRNIGSSYFKKYKVFVLSHTFYMCLNCNLLLKFVLQSRKLPKSKGHVIDEKVRNDEILYRSRCIDIRLYDMCNFYFVSFDLIHESIYIIESFYISSSVTFKVFYLIISRLSFQY